MTRHAIPRGPMFKFVGSNVEIEYHRKQRSVNIEITPFDLSEAFIKSRPTFPHKRQTLEKHKIQHKFEIKTAVLLILFCFLLSEKPNRDPPSTSKKIKKMNTCFTSDPNVPCFVILKQPITLMQIDSCRTRSESET